MLRRQILIVDDDEPSLDVMQTLLRTHGYEPVLAQSGTIALELARRQPPDLVISDVLMPDMDGFELCRRWKADPTLSSIPFVFYTASYTDPQDEDFARKLGADRFLRKPTEPEQLMAVFEEMLGASEPIAAEPAASSTVDEQLFLREHSQSLVRKLTQKVHELENARTELEQSLAQLRDAQLSLRMTQHSIDNCATPVFWIRADSTFRYVNDAACSLLGYRHDELARMAIPDIDLDWTREYWEESGWARLRNPVSQAFEVRLRRKNGTSVPAEVNTSYMEFEGEDYLFAFVSDLTERVEARTALAEREALLSAAIEQSQVGIIIASAPDVRIRLVNPAAAAILGETEALIGANREEHAERWQNFRPDGTKYTWRERPLARAVLEGQTTRAVEILIRRPDDQERLVLANAAPIHDPAGRIVAGIVTIQDITDRKQAEDDRREALVEIAELKKRLEAENLYLQEEIRHTYGHEEIAGNSPQLQEVLHQVDQVAPTDATVLILGETGTGKELVARAVHDRSGRGGRPLVKVNCAALPETLIESELFGHEKGAFTGATARRQGRFELADRGTIFLDEIGDLPLSLQAKLLRVLQEGEFERLGGTETLEVDVRIIAATNRDLEEAIADGRFRTDLYYRLTVFPIYVPPLRERIQDIPLLTSLFVSRKQERLDKKILQIPDEIMQTLCAYSWPGNVRELDNVIERAMILSPGTTLALPISLREPTQRTPVEPAGPTLETVERTHIERVLRECHGRIKGVGNAADRLGLKPSTLRDRLKKLKISRR